MNSRIKRSKAQEWDDRPDSITVKLAPLSLSILKYTPLRWKRIEPKKKNPKQPKIKKRK